MYCTSSFSGRLCGWAVIRPAIERNSSCCTLELVVSRPASARNSSCCTLELVVSRPASAHNSSCSGDRVGLKKVCRAGSCHM
eukprot:363413-Chlamydomonas_euryale.AAC.7